MLVELAVNKNGPLVLRSERYQRLSVAKRIALLEVWLESLAIEITDLEERR